MEWAPTAILTAIAATTATGMTGMTGRTGAAPSGSERVPIRDRPEPGQKPLKSGGFSPFREPPEPGKTRFSLLDITGRFAKRRPLARAFPDPSSGRIAQLVEQMTLNQRVPGSSPGAPTKPKALFLNKLEERSREQNGSRATLFVMARRTPCDELTEFS